MAIAEKASNNLIGLRRPETEPTRSSKKDFVQWITDQVSALALALGDDLSAERLLVYAENLCDIPKERLTLAFEKTCKEYKYPKLPPVAIIREMAGISACEDGRPGPEEAWARMPKGERVEMDSVVWCEEERIAYGSCRSLLVDGDQIAARMAFKERYERELAAARALGKPARWTISAGYDLERRLSVLAEAVEEKRLTLQAALEFVPEPRQGQFAQMLPPGSALGQVKGMLAGRTAQPLPNLPGLPGLLAKLRMEGALPAELKVDSRPSPAEKREVSDDEIRTRRAELKSQLEFLERSRHATQVEKQ